MLTREDTKRVQGELAMAGDAWVITVGGIKLRRRKARVNPSTMERQLERRGDGWHLGEGIDQCLDSGVERWDGTGHHERWRNPQ